MAKGLIIAAASSGSGKTVVTLGLLRALRNHRIDVGSAKVGPDYIDPRFHEAATGTKCYNLDGWAMTPNEMRGLLRNLGKSLVVIEGVMGLFDGPENGRGSSADVAQDLGLPVLLVVDASHQAQSVAALVHGFATFRPGVSIAGVILNRVASPRHRDMLTTSLDASGVPVVGIVMRDEVLVLPSRHLGLVQASENEGLEEFIEIAARKVTETINIHLLADLARDIPHPDAKFGLPPLGQTIAVAKDDAFAFAYPHVLDAWRAAGAAITLFSPLANEAPPSGVDAIYLPGGYPELHAGRLAQAAKFHRGLRNASALIYGECGGFMVLGEYLIDAAGERHHMAGLLPLGTTFATRKLHLGYRQLTHQNRLPFPGKLRCHEFHYSNIDWQGAAEPLFQASDAAGRDLTPMGLCRNRIMGSYAHVIA